MKNLITLLLFQLFFSHWSFAQDQNTKKLILKTYQTLRKNITQIRSDQVRMSKEIRLLKERIEKLESKQSTSKDSSSKNDDGYVNLDDLEKRPSETTSSTLPSPQFKFYFDLWLTHMPGVSPVSFDSAHSLVLIEYQPMKELKFTAELNPASRFFEIDYDISKRLKVRFGKIWIPFDDFAPHNIFGGRMNTQFLRPIDSNTGSRVDPFLPNLWADLGVGFQYDLVQSSTWNLISHLYVVNGFGSGGNDPKGELGTNYPSFSDERLSDTATTGADNNSEKNFGGRLQAKYGESFAIGTSFQTGRWTDRTEESKSLSVFGLDFQWKWSELTAFRFGYITMSVNLPSTATKTEFRKNGYYGEATRKFSSRSPWKITLRGGGVNNDSRIIDASTQQNVGSILSYRMGPMELSGQYFRDLKKVDSKVNYSFFALRLAAMF